MVSDTAALGVAMLEERVAKVPEQIDATLALSMPATPRGSRWITAGVGASEGPARLLSSLLCGGGVWAEYAPLSSFVGETLSADVCVLFSQSLSPNARLVLRARERFGDVLVVSSVTSEHPLGAAVVARGARLASHGPTDERGLLLRVLGPAAACVMASRLAADASGAPPWRAQLSLLPSCVASVARPVAPEHARIVVVCANDDPRVFEGMRLKLVEGLGVGAALVDVCAVAHGPLQSFWDESTTVVTLEHRDDLARGLFDRLADVLQPRHQLIRLEATLPRPMSYFEHAAMLDHLVLAALRVHPRDLCEWPGKGRDGALYDVGGEVLE